MCTFPNGNVYCTLYETNNAIPVTGLEECALQFFGSLRKNNFFCKSPNHHIRPHKFFFRYEKSFDVLKLCLTRTALFYILMTYFLRHANKWKNFLRSSQTSQPEWFIYKGSFALKFPSPHPHFFNERWQANRIFISPELINTGWDTKIRNLLFGLFWFEQVPEICSNVLESAPFQTVIICRHSIYYKYSKGRMQADSDTFYLC